MPVGVGCAGVEAGVVLVGAVVEVALVVGSVLEVSVSVAELAVLVASVLTSDELDAESPAPPQVPNALWHPVPQ